MNDATRHRILGIARDCVQAAHTTQHLAGGKPVRCWACDQPDQPLYRVEPWHGYAKDLCKACIAALVFALSLDAHNVKKNGTEPGQALGVDGGDAK